MIDKALLTRAFEKMGPDAVERGLRKHVFLQDDPFYSCFLACAFGEEGSLKDRLDDYWLQDRGAPTAWPAPMGLSRSEFQHIWETVDRHHDAFWALANEWLENRPARHSANRPVESVA